MRYVLEYSSACDERYAPVAQLDRVTDYESVGRGFESLPAYQKKAHICLPRQCVLFSTKFAFGE